MPSDLKSAAINNLRRAFGYNHTMARLNAMDGKLGEIANLIRQLPQRPGGTSAAGGLVQNVLDIPPSSIESNSSGTTPMHEAANSFPIAQFWEPSFWEAMVQIALRDYCKPGDIAFDVGANAGALAAIMSRHVGPRGIVCAFEASPRIINKTHYNLVQGGYTNVSLYYRAVYHTSNEVVTLYPGDHLNDSIYNDLGAEGGASYRVETLALDDFVTATGLMPRIIKMDIEGAELDALKGATRILAEGKPLLILEQSPSDMSCHELLAKAGYVAVDLSNYRRIRSAADFDAGISIANILFIHESQAADDRYYNAGEPVEIARLTPDMFAMAPGGNLSLKKPLDLPAGRYVCRTEFTASGRDNEIFAGIDTDRGRVQRYHTYTALMAETYRDWAFNLRVAGQVTPYIEFIRGNDPSFRWNGATIYRYAGFDGMQPPVVF